MDPFGIGISGLGAAGAATIGAFGLAFRARRRRLASAAAIAAASGEPLAGLPEAEGPDGVAGFGHAVHGRTDRDRIEALATAQAELALRLDALAAAGSAPEEKLQAMAGQLLGLIRDKNATLETAMTGLDQLRARMKALEEMGEPAEARGLFEGLKSRMGELETRQAAASAALEARLAALASGGGTSELAERLARLHEARDAGLEAALARLAPLETRLAGLESGIGAGREAAKRLETALAALQGEQAQARTEIAALRAAAETAPVRAEARVEAVRAELFERIDAFERALAARDPQAALDRFAERLEAVQDRLVLIETAENPLGEVSEKLASLYAQKDAAVEAMLGRLAPLEARLGGMEREIAGLDPQDALDRLAARVEAVQGRVALIETAGNPLAEITEQLARIHAQKEAAVEAVLARLGPLEERLLAFEREIAAKDPRVAIEQLAARLEGVAGRVSLLETAESPLGEITERLAALHAQKDATVETVIARLGPIEERVHTFEREIAAKDPQGALDRFAERLEGVAGRVSLLETAENPLGEITERLARIHAQKEAAVEAVIARLGPVEDRLGGVEREIAAKDPQGALDRFAERLEGVAGRLAAVETAESPLAEVTETLGALYAQKEAAVEAVLSRLGPLEAKLAAVEGGLSRSAEDDPRAGFGEIADRLARLFADRDTGRDTESAAIHARLAPLEAAVERFAPLEAAVERLAPLEAVTERLAVLEAAMGRLGLVDAAVERIAALEGTLGRLAPIEARLASLEARDDPEAARAMAGEVAAELAALRADAAAQTALFADRIALLEATLPRLDARQAALMRAAAAPTAPSAQDPAQDPVSEEEAIWALPRVISLHK